MTDKIKLIKEEIERQIEEGKMKCQQSKENNDHESLVAWSEHVATCGKLLVFINSIQEESLSEDFESQYKSNMSYQHAYSQNDLMKTKNSENNYL